MNLFIFKNFYKHHFGNILIGFLLFHLLTSFIHKLVNFIYNYNFIHPITAFLKLVFLFFFIIILIVNFNKKRILFLYFGLLIFLFILANLKLIFIQNSGFNLYNSFTEGNIFYLIKYLYPFIFLGAFSLMKNKEKKINRYFDVLEKILIVNAFFVFLGFLFSIDFMQSYPLSSRFGYCGILERLYFAYFSMIIILRKIFLNKIDIRLLILCLVLLLSGMKVIFLFFMVLTIFYLYDKRKIKILYFLLFVIIFGTVFIKSIVNFLIKIFPFWQSIYNKYGYTTVLFSTRDLAFNNTLDYLIKEGSLCNLLIGGVEFPKYFIEMDFIDLFLFFGIIGMGIYISLLSKIINKYYHFIPLIASFFGGGFLFGTIITCTYFLWFYESNIEKNKLF